MKTRDTEIPFINTPVAKDITYTVLLIPVFWILGFNFFIFHFITFWMFIKILLLKKRQGKKISIPSPLWYLGIFLYIYLLSIILNIHQISIDRLLATFYNMSFWIMGWVLIFVIYNSVNKEDLLPILKPFNILGFASGLFCIFSIFLWFSGIHYLSIRSILSYLVPTKYTESMPLLNYSLYPFMVAMDWTDYGLLPRTSGFNVYSTVLSATMGFCILFTFFFIRTQRINSSIILILLLELFALVVGRSRTVIFGFLMAWISVYILTHTYKSWIRVFSPFFLIAIVIALRFISLPNLVDPILQYRPGSTAYRIMIWNLSLSYVEEKPLLGYGHKPRLDYISIPIGSHSGYLSIIFRTGIIGLLAFSLFWASILKRWWRYKSFVKNRGQLYHLWYYLGIALILQLLWMLTEDIDAPPIFAFLCFLVNGLIISIKKWSKTSEIIQNVGSVE